MIEISFPDLPERSLNLVPQVINRHSREEVLDGPGPDAPTERPTTALAGRLRLGGPVPVPVTAAYAQDDPALRTYVEQEAGKFTYHLVHLSITATTEPGQERLERVSLRLELSGSQSTPKPIAWSLSPTRVVDASQLETTWHLGPSLKLFGVEAEVGSVEQKRIRERTQVYLEALNELRADPTWNLRRTRDMPIQGGHRLVLVVRVPVGGAARIDCSVDAVIARGVRPWKETTPLPGLLSLSATL